MTRDSQAYEAYLEGQVQRRKNSSASIARAREHFEFATERDPDFLLAWLELSDSLRILSGNFRPEGNALRARADAVLEEVMRRSTDPRLVQAINISRQLSTGDWAAVERGKPVLEGGGQGVPARVDHSGQQRVRPALDGRGQIRARNLLGPRAGPQRSTPSICAVSANLAGAVRARRPPCRSPCRTGALVAAISPYAPQASSMWYCWHARPAARS